MDFQHGIVGAVPHAQESGLLERVAGVIATCRSARVPIVHVGVGFRPGHPEVSPRNKRFAPIRERGGMVQGSPGTEFVQAVSPRPDEPVVVKHRVGAFSSTDLQMILSAYEATSLVLCGFSTSGVVLSTLVAAADLDYRLIVLEDCCDDPDAELHAALMGKYFPRAADVLSAAAFAEQLLGANEANATAAR